MAATLDRPLRWLEPWAAPYVLVNGVAAGITPLLLSLATAHAGAGRVGIVLGAYNAGAVAAPLAGASADRWRLHRLLAVGCALALALALWGFPLAAGMSQVALAILAGASTAGMLTVADLLIVERAPADEWSRRLSALDTVLSIGQAGALVLAGVLTALDVRSGLWVDALFPAAAAPLAALFVRSPMRQVPEAAHVRPAALGRGGAYGPAGASRGHQRATVRGLRHGLRIAGGAFGWLMLAWIPAYGAGIVVYAFYPVLFKQVFHVAPMLSSLAYALILIATLPLYAAAGRWAQQRGPHLVLLGGLLLQLAALGGLAALTLYSPAPAGAAMAAFGALAWSWPFLIVAAPGLAGLLVPQAEGAAQGMLNACSGLAGLIGAVGGGALAARWGYGPALEAATGATLLGVLVLILAGGAMVRASKPAPQACLG
jgi:predicted MFS family arabinose efflux permease